MSPNPKPVKQLVKAVTGAARDTIGSYLKVYDDDSCRIEWLESFM